MWVFVGCLSVIELIHQTSGDNPKQIEQKNISRKTEDLQINDRNTLICVIKTVEFDWIHSP